MNCIFLCDGECDCAPDGSSKHDYLVSSQSVRLQEGHNSARICFDISWRGLSLVDAVPSVFHGHN